MAGLGLYYYNSSWGQTDPQVTTLVWQVTGAGPVLVSVPLGPPVLATHQPLTQPTIDAFLGTSSEFTAAQFDATSMGVDAFGCIINMLGQASFAVGFEISFYTGALGATEVRRAALGGTLAPNALQTAIAVGANGNIAFQAVMTGFDALTSGLVIAHVYWIAQ